MPVHDYRRLSFDLDAIKSSLQMNGKVSQRLKLFPGRLAKIVLCPGSETIDLEYFSERDPVDVLTRTLTAVEMTAILLEYCLKGDIPIPRVNGRQMSIEEDRITISFTKIINIQD